MNKNISLILTLVLTLGGALAHANDIEQEVQIGVYGTEGPESKGGVPASQLEEYGELSRGVIFEKYLLDADLENYNIEATARDLNKNTRAFVIEAGKRGKSSFKLNYEEMPHLYTNEGRSLYQDTGNGELRISSPTYSDIAHSVDSSSHYAPGVLKSAVDNQPFMSVGVLIKKMGVELKYHPDEYFAIHFDGMRTTKRGTRPQAASFGFSNAIELAAPVDESVVEGGVGISYTRKRYQLGFDYHFEDFNNSIPTLVWDNPKNMHGEEYYLQTHYSRGDGSSVGRMAMAPDNKAHSFKFEGGVDMGETTRFGFEGGFQRWSALNQMLPYTNNTAMTATSVGGTAAGLTFDASDPNNRPDPNVNSLIEVYTYMGKLSSRPLSWLRTSLLHESYIMENKSKKLTVPGWAVFDQNWHVEEASPQLEQFRDDKTVAKAEYDITSTISGNTSVMYKYMKKTRAVDKGREYELNTGFTLKPRKNLWVNLGFLVSGRRASGWDFQHYPTATSGGARYFTESPGLMRPDVADRNRNQGRLQVQWMPGDASINFSARMTQDGYRGGKNQDLTGGHSEVVPDLFGVLSDRHQSLAFDASLPATEALDVDVFYGYDFHRQIVRSAQMDTLTNIFGAGGTTRIMVTRPQDRWEQRNTEHAHMVGLAFTHRPMQKMTNRVGLDSTFTRSNGDPLVVGSRNVAMTPLQTSRRVKHTIKASSKYKFTKDLTLAANYMFERFQANDFAYSGIPTVLSNSSHFLGADPIKTYNFHSLGMSMNYRF